MTAAPDPVDHVTVPGGGAIGMVACPGGMQRFGADIRDIDEDLGRLKSWGAEGVVTLFERVEFDMLGVPDLPERALEAGFWWRHLPIRDMCAPDEDFERSWIVEGAHLRDRLGAGARIVLHCWAGLGRTGTIAARLLVELGQSPDDAIRAVREAREGAIQSLQQELHVHACRPVD